MQPGEAPVQMLIEVTSRSFASHPESAAFEDVLIAKIEVVCDQHLVISPSSATALLYKALRTVAVQLTICESIFPQRFLPSSMKVSDEDRSWHYATGMTESQQELCC